LSLAIRPAAAGDAGTIVRLITDLADYERLSDEVVVTEADIVRDLFGADPKVFCEIAEWEGAPVGFALWFYTYSTFLGRHGIWLEDLFVDPGARGRGIGKALLRQLARRCVADGLGRVEWSVLDWNTPSIAFYKAQGADLLQGAGRRAARGVGALPARRRGARPLRGAVSAARSPFR
jgi:GNAT superfamily N-acetyltransferase